MNDVLYHPKWPDKPQQELMYPRKKRKNRPKNAGRVRRRLWIEDPHCHYCGKLLAYEESTLDHKLAKARGGMNGIFNLVLSCKKCNTEKADKDYGKFLRRRKSS